MTNKKVYIPYTAQGWQLYTKREGAEEAATKLCKLCRIAVKNCVHEYMDDQELNIGPLNVNKLVAVNFKPVTDAMTQYADLGACDSEPCWMLEKIEDAMREALELLPVVRSRKGT